MVSPDMMGVGRRVGSSDGSRKRSALNGRYHDRLHASAQRDALGRTQLRTCLQNEIPRREHMIASQDDGEIGGSITVDIA